MYRFSLQYSTHVEMEACLIIPNIGVAYNSDNNTNSTNNNSDDDNNNNKKISITYLHTIYIHNT